MQVDYSAELLRDVPGFTFDVQPTKNGPTRVGSSRHCTIVLMNAIPTPWSHIAEAPYMITGIEVYKTKAEIPKEFARYTWGEGRLLARRVLDVRLLRTPVENSRCLDYHDSSPRCTDARRRGSAGRGTDRCANRPARPRGLRVCSPPRGARRPTRWIALRRWSIDAQRDRPRGRRRSSRADSVVESYGDRPLVIGSVHIALRTSGANVDPSTDRPVTFNGRSSIVIRAGANLVSDGVSLAMPNLADVAISMFITDSARLATRTHWDSDELRLGARRLHGAASFASDTTLRFGPSWPASTSSIPRSRA